MTILSPSGSNATRMDGHGAPTYLTVDCGLTIDPFDFWSNFEGFEFWTEDQSLVDIRWSVLSDSSINSCTRLVVDQLATSEFSHYIVHCISFV